MPDIKLWALGALVALMTLISVGLTIYYKKQFIQEWLRLMPLRIDKDLKIYKHICALKITRYHQEVLRLCKILNIKVPITYLVGDMGNFQRKSLAGYTLYKKKPLVVIYYDASDRWIFTVAHEMYHLYQRSHHPERFTKNGVLVKWIEQCEIEAQAFAVAYLESNYSTVSIEPRDWEHGALSEAVINNRNDKNEIVVIRAMAETFKEKYFKGNTQGKPRCTKCS